MIAFAALLFSTPLAFVEEKPLLPGELAIYYGYPSLVNGVGGDLDAAADVFDDYDVVVFGAGLETPTHPDHANTASIIAKLEAGVADVEVYGYIEIGQLGATPPTEADFNALTDLWGAMSVDGIFFDEAGWDYGVTRSLLVGVVQHAHSQGLRAFVNAWNPDDVFSPAAHPTYNPAGDPTPLGPQDTYLLESYQVILSTWQAASSWVSKAEEAHGWSEIHGTAMATVTTVSPSQPGFDQAMMDYAWWSTLLYDFEFMGWGELWFSAAGSLLPYRTRPDPGYVGGSYLEDVQHVGDLHSRATAVGTVQVDSAAHLGSFTPIPCGFTTFGVGLSTVNDLVLTGSGSTSTGDTPTATTTVPLGIPGALGVLGTSQLTFPLFGGFGLVAPTPPLIVLSLTATGATATWPLPIPDSVNLVGQTVFLQTGAIDPTKAQGLALSNGLSVTICP